MAAHAELSASGSKKWMTCSMAAAMEYGLPDEDSEYSLEGTCAHAVGDVRLHNRLIATALAEIRDETQVENYKRFFNQDFSNFVDSYVTFVVERVGELRQEHGHENVVVLLEQRLDFSRWVPEGFGTGDVVIIVPGKIIVVDLKFGAGVFVQGRENSQTRLYGVAALDRYEPLFGIDHVETVIHQPRKDNVTGEEILAADLVGWAETVVAPRAELAWANLQARKLRTIPIAYDRSKFTPGEHCSEGFCKARYTCRARAEYNIGLLNEPYTHEEPAHLTVDQLEHVASYAATLVKWVKDVEGYLFRQANDGKIELKNFMLSTARGARTIADPVAAAQLLLSNGFDRSKIFKPAELEGITHLEQLVGKKRLAEILGELVEKKPGATKLAPRTAGGDEAAPRRGTAEEAFS